MGTGEKVSWIRRRWEVGPVGFLFACLALAVVFVAVVGLVPICLAPAQESARRVSCLSNMRQIELAMIQYAGDYNDTYPSALLDENEPAQRRFARLLKENYLNSPKVFHCPVAPLNGKPDPTKLSAETITDSSEGSIADVYLSVDWCSYGVDPRVQQGDPTSRAVVADRPDERYWGTGVSSPGAGQKGSNSGNHKGDGQNVAYNDGHVKWGSTARDDAGVDPNVYGVNPEINAADDSNIDFGTKPTQP